MISDEETQPAKASLPSKSPSKTTKKPAKEAKPAVPVKLRDPQAGMTLLRSIGCLACHSVGNLGGGELFGGGDLTRVASKRPAEFFAAWLARPEALNRDHRMPVFRLSDVETGHLAAYLQTLRDGSAPRMQGEVNPNRNWKFILKREYGGKAEYTPETTQRARVLSSELAPDLLALARVLYESEGDFPAAPWLLNRMGP